ncbi:hypothetical protein SAMD00079811_68970 [Scytonema sp. HK-05]|uniref:O-antigen ligase family protein n=1 Tax=Scytonema sp. HK-05 TaxID=1137095 RepID=UPI000937DFA8|nr:O-antigen ligase family protein [Scytonema sp. HK-05]OKH58469.1 capsular biosynthesis protein [Scytonema sp. HK-05]BAY49268.1 hypothetical protein SAMD00079811_68970 [Scytonema sp. HK-05]
MKPINFPERIIWYSIIGTYVFYLIGGLYIVGSVIGWILLIYLCKKLWNQTEATPPDERITIPLTTWIWIGGMLVMELALIAGHFNFDLGTSLLIKSSIGWAKGWALLAVFPLVGVLKIRPQLLWRSACIVCFQTLLFAPVFFLAYLLHLPETAYVSPLKIVGGPGDEFFALRLYEIDPSNGLPRWRLFTPWAPALGFMANIYFFMALQETNKKWRWIAIVGSLFMCIISASRLALLSIIVVFLLTSLLTNLARPIVLIALGFVSFIGSLITTTLLRSYEDFQQKFTDARPDSSRVRKTLAKIALDRSSNEAPIWGHGVVEQGPHLVEYMPIGSHHTWYGLLFVKGFVGLFALALPMLCTFLDLLVKAQQSETAKVGLSMILILFLYTFGENLEILSYLFWPALVIIGIALKGEVQGPISLGKHSEATPH